MCRQKIKVNMKIIKSIFSKIFMTSLILGCVLVMPTWAAVSNGCDNPDNEYIIPSLALCSTHVYNIGQETNPSYESRTLMQDVIALKTTVIAQQMYKQYEYLEAMVRRLKTQLEKATLTASLQAAGATSDSSSGGSSSWRDADKSVYMSAGVTNCMNIYDDAKILECYQNNINSIVSQSGNGNKPTREMKQQLVSDLMNLKGIKFETATACDNVNDADCINLTKAAAMSVDKFRTCLNQARQCLQNQTREYKNQQLKLQSSVK